MARKFFASLGVALLLTTMISCRPSEDNQEYEPKVARVEVIAEKMANGTASISEMTECLSIVQELSDIEDKEGKVLSSSQMSRLEEAAKKLSE